MSTKIYNGYRIHPKDRSFEGVWRFMTSAMKRIRRVGESKAERIIIETAIGNLDALKAGYATDLGGLEKGELFKLDPKNAHVGNAICIAAHVFSDKASEIKKSNLRSPFYDVSFEAVILLVPPPRKDILVITYTEDRDMEAAWKRTTGVEFFGYWDNTDPDESCSEKEWAYRGNAWAAALGGDFRDSPGKSGMTVQAIPIGWSPMMGMWGHELGKAKKIALALEKKGMTLDERAKRIAKARLVGLRVQRAMKKAPKKDRFDVGLRAYREAGEWVKKHPASVERLASKVKAKLGTVEELFSVCFAVNSEGANEERRH
jgi:hypothetical protein